jgi:hypothetical protein
MKICTDCKVEKEESDFRRNSRAKDGRAWKCKTCSRERIAKWHAEHPEKAKAYRAKHRAEHPEKAKAYSAKHRAENAEKVKARIAKYRAENAEKVKAQQAEYFAKYRAENAEKMKAQRARYSAELDTVYVKQLLGIPDPPPELIEMKREQILMHRATKQLQQILKEKIDE